MRGQTPVLRGIRIFAFSDVVAGLVGQSFRRIHMKAESMDGSKKRETVFNNVVMDRPLDPHMGMCRPLCCTLPGNFRGSSWTRGVSHKTLI